MAVTTQTRSSDLRHYSPLRYPGGKARLSPVVQSVLEENDLVDGEYAEPYAGGAGIALTLLFREFVSHIHINDLDKSLYAFWHSILNQTEAFCRLVRDTPLTYSEWEQQRSIQSSKKRCSLLRLGFSTFYLNRTNRSGIIASGGIIGGHAQDGFWGMDARYNSSALIRRIERIARYRDRISVYNLDAEQFLSHTDKVLPKKSLTYLDPPYFIKGTRRLYANYYEREDHANIAQHVQQLRNPWIVSYDAAPEILALYRHLPHVRYNIRYSASSVTVGREAMFFARGLVPPAKDTLSGHLPRWKL